jgi:hypothetical protein
VKNVNKFTMKIFDNETGKLVKSIDYNTVVAGFSHEKDGETVVSSFVNAYGNAVDVAEALDAADTAQQEIMKAHPEIGVAHMMMKGLGKKVVEDGTDKEYTD